MASQLPHDQLPQIQGCKQHSSLISPFPWFKDPGRGSTGSDAQGLTGRTLRSRPAGAEDPSEALVPSARVVGGTRFLADGGQTFPRTVVLRTPPSNQRPP